jgi:SIT4-associating protein SAP185/190
MFWRFGGYGNVSTIDNILERENFQLEELLDDGELVQELKAHNAKLVEYLRGPEVLEKLLSYVVAPKLEPVAAPDDDEDEDADEKGKGIALPFTRSRSSSSVGGTTQEDSEKKRNRYAFIATEILSSETWSMYEALMDSKPLLRSFWQFLKRDTPLDPLQASYFTKVNESLFDKKTEEMIDLLKSMDGAVSDILRHVDCPMIMDLLLKIISLERTESGQGIVEVMKHTIRLWDSGLTMSSHSGFTHKMLCRHLSRSLGRSTVGQRKHLQPTLSRLSSPFPPTRHKTSKRVSVRTNSRGS